MRRVRVVHALLNKTSLFLCLITDVPRGLVLCLLRQGIIRELYEKHNNSAGKTLRHPQYLIGVIDGSFEMGKNRIFMRQQTFRCVSIPSPPPSSCQGSRLSCQKILRRAMCAAHLRLSSSAVQPSPQTGQKQLQTPLKQVTTCSVKRSSSPMQKHFYVLLMHKSITMQIKGFTLIYSMVIKKNMALPGDMFASQS